VGGNFESLEQREQVPGGYMRASGELQTVFAVESHMDMIASEIEMDPLEFRLLNALRLTSLPISCEKVYQGLQRKQ